MKVRRRECERHAEQKLDPAPVHRKKRKRPNSLFQILPPIRGWDCCNL